MKYIHYFGTEAAYNQARENNYVEPWVSYTEGKGLDYNIDYTKIPFTIEALGTGNITWALGAKNVQYSKNGGSWETMTKDTTISVVDGDEVQFKGMNANYNGNNISSTAQFNVKGNIVSLTDGDDYETANTVSANGFSGFFANCTNLISAGNLKLPTTLGQLCYFYMFVNCTNLISAPELPSTELSVGCYANMFNNCTSLTVAPSLPATTLSNECYANMFNNCTSLTVAPELPATILLPLCYGQMFYGCSNLSYIKAMFTTTPGSSYTSSWVSGVASNGTFVKNASATWTTTGVHGIPEGWTVQTAST